MIPKSRKPRKPSNFCLRDYGCSGGPLACQELYRRGKRNDGRERGERKKKNYFLSRHE